MRSTPRRQSQARVQVQVGISTWIASQSKILIKALSAARKPKALANSMQREIILGP